MNYPEGSIVAVAERLRRDSPHAADALDMYQRRILGAFEYMAQMCIAAGVAADVVGPSAVLLLVWEAYAREMSGQATNEVLGVPSRPLSPEEFGRIAERIAREALALNGSALAEEQSKFARERRS